MRIVLITPARPWSRSGNRTTTRRWARLLRDLGHRVRIATDYDDAPADVMIALHAWRSAAAIRRFRRRWPDPPLVVALAGTDLYEYLDRDARRTLQSLRAADRLVALHDLAGRRLPDELRGKLRVIKQSAQPLPSRSSRGRAERGSLPLQRGGPGRGSNPANDPLPTASRSASPFQGEVSRTSCEAKCDSHGRRGGFDVAVIGHLRRVKDPLRAAFAARLMPPQSRLRILHVGGAEGPRWAAAAQAEMRINPRYVWRGEVSGAAIRKLLGRVAAVVLSSLNEGGANVVSEAVAAGVPVIASRIDGSVGLLGRDYPGYFPPGNTKALARMLRRVETDRAFLIALRRAIRRLRHDFAPARERSAWRALLRELASETPAMTRS
jgi:glycosyltransferase involved in cell wall biosynthesis